MSNKNHWEPVIAFRSSLLHVRFWRLTFNSLSSFLFFSKLYILLLRFLVLILLWSEKCFSLVLLRETFSPSHLSFEVHIIPFVVNGCSYSYIANFAFIWPKIATMNANNLYIILILVHQAFVHISTYKKLLNAQNCSWSWITFDPNTFACSEICKQLAEWSEQHLVYVPVAY